MCTSEVENVKNKGVTNGQYFMEKIKDQNSDEFKKINKMVAIGVTLCMI